MKRKYNDPYIIVGGDFNQWDLESSLADYGDLVESPVGARKSLYWLDILKLWWLWLGVRGPPPIGDPGFTEKEQPFSCLFKSWYTKVRSVWDVDLFLQTIYGIHQWKVLNDWGDVLRAQGSNEKALAYQAHIDGALDRFFPVRTTTQNSTDPPWINWAVRKRVKQRRGVFMREGRSKKWKRLKKLTGDLIRRRRNIYMDSQRIAPRWWRPLFFLNVRSYKSKENPKPFNIRYILTGKTNSQYLEELAVYFNTISNEFSPLEQSDIPITHHRLVEPLQPYQVSGWL